MISLSDVSLYYEFNMKNAIFKIDLLPKIVYEEFLRTLREEIKHRNKKNAYQSSRENGDYPKRTLC